MIGRRNQLKLANIIQKISPDTKMIIRKLLRKFSLTDTVEIVHKIGNIGKNEIYREALEQKNEK